MKIGVITHWRSDDNYGQTLQLYALQQVLIQQGHDPYLIRYITNEGSLRWRLKRKFVALRDLPTLIKRKWHRLQGTAKADRSRGAQRFIAENVIVSDCIYTRKSILQSPPQADAFITGSDQVWNKIDGSYFLDFVKDPGVKKISYAASFGGRKYKGLDKYYVKKWLKSFDAISVREQDGEAQCREMGFESARLVPDPTMLLRREDYEKLFEKSLPERPYILVYLLGSKMTFDVDKIYQFAQKHNLDVRYIASQGQADGYDKIYPDIREWLSLISSAEYVVTNSFHGTVFSMIFQKQFISIPLTGESAKMNGRLTTLLGRFSLSERFTQNLEILPEPIDYSNHKEQVENYRAIGLSFLKNSLKA